MATGRPGVDTGKPNASATTGIGYCNTCAQPAEGMFCSTCGARLAAAPTSLPPREVLADRFTEDGTCRVCGATFHPDLHQAHIGLCTASNLGRPLDIDRRYTSDGVCRGCGKPVETGARTLHPRYCTVPISASRGTQGSIPDAGFRAAHGSAFSPASSAPAASSPTQGPTRRNDPPTMARHSPLFRIMPEYRRFVALLAVVGTVLAGVLVIALIKAQGIDTNSPAYLDGYDAGIQLRDVATDHADFVSRCHMTISASWISGGTAEGEIRTATQGCLDAEPAR